MSNNEAKPVSGKNLWVGLIVLTVGVLLLLHGMDLVFFPWWLFRWPTILIIIGIILGVKSNFQNGGWLVMVLIGGFFLLNELDLFDRDLWKYGPAVAVIILGAFIIFRALARRTGDYPHGEWQGRNDKGTESGSFSGDTTVESSTLGGGEDHIDLVNVFGGSKRRIFSKNFKGGETTNFFGGTHLDLTQADLDGEAVIDITCVFGGVQLIVPSNWFIESRITTVLGGLEDKRAPSTTPDASRKRLVLTGVCLLGGIEIKSFF